MKINELFRLRQGNGFELYNMSISESHDVAFVSRTAQNNGVVAYVEKADSVSPFPSGLITVALGGSVLSAFVQRKPFYTAFHIMVLEPLRDMSFNEKLFYCMCIQNNAYRYNYGRQANKTLKDIKIIDYFPAEIINNFDFAYVSEANIGTISATVDKSNNSITWTIPELANGETATVQYKLKLKENFDSSIVDKILNTNQKVDITYKDYDNKEQTKTSDISPKLKLTEPPATLPKAGITTFIVTGSIVAISILIFSTAKLLIINRKMK